MAEQAFLVVAAWGLHCTRVFLPPRCLPSAVSAGSVCTQGA